VDHTETNCEDGGSGSCPTEGVLKRCWTLFGLHYHKVSHFVVL